MVSPGAKRPLAGGFGDGFGSGFFKWSLLELRGHSRCRFGNGFGSEFSKWSLLELRDYLRYGFGDGSVTVRRRVDSRGIPGQGTVGGQGMVNSGYGRVTVSVRTDRWRDGWTVGKRDGWTVGERDGWTVGEGDGWTVEQPVILLYALTRSCGSGVGLVGTPVVPRAGTDQHHKRLQSVFLG